MSRSEYIVMKKKTSHRQVVWQNHFFFHICLPFLSPVLNKAKIPKVKSICAKLCIYGFKQYIYYNRVSNLSENCIVFI